MTLSHDECRPRVCAVCYDEKGRKSETGRLINNTLQKSIRDLVNINFNLTDPSLPSGLCTTCRIRLTQHSNWKSSGHSAMSPPKALDIAKSYENPLIVATRSSQHCTCRICTYVRRPGLDRKGLLYNKKPSQVIKVCSVCKAILSPGLPHSKQQCASKVARCDNIAVLAGSDLEKVAANVIKEKVLEGSGGDTIHLQGQFGGKPIQLRVNRPSPKARVQLSLGDIQELRGMGMSDRHVLGAVSLMKSKDNKSVAPNIPKMIVKEKRMLDNYFEKKSVQVLHESSKKSKLPNKVMTRPAVYCSNVTGFRDRVADARGISDAELQSKLGLDSGKGIYFFSEYIFKVSFLRSSEAHSYFLQLLPV